MSGESLAIESIAVDKLVLPEDGIRADVGDVSELASSIMQQGVLEPLLVEYRSTAAKGALDVPALYVVCGSRRLTAAKKAGLTEVPCLVRQFTEQERVEVMLVENMQRQNLTPLEEASAFKRLVDFGLSQRDVAKRVGCSQAHVSRRVGLLDLPFSVQLNVNTGTITSEEATELVKLKDDPDLVEALVDVKKKAGAYAQPISGAVKRETEKKKRQQAVDAEIAKLQKKGVDVVALAGDAHGYYVRAPEGYAIVAEIAHRSDEVQVDPAKHARQKCHAVGIAPNDASHVELCSDPSKHPSPADERKAEEEQRKAEAAASKKAWLESIDRRREFVGSYVRGKVATDVAIRLAWIVVSLGASSQYGPEDEDELACQMLGIELLDDQQNEDGDGTVSLDAVDELARLAAGSNADRIRALAALSAANLEVSCSNTYGRWGMAERSYVELLKTVGFEPSAPELEELEVEVEA